MVHPGGKTVHLLIGASDGHELFMTLLRLDTSFATTLRAALKSISNSILGFKAQTYQNHPPVVLRPKPSNPVGGAYPLRLLHDLNMCHYSSLTPCKENGPLAHLLWILVFDVQHNQIGLMNLQVFVL